MSGFGLVLANYIRRGFAYRWVMATPTVLVFALVTFYVSIQADSYESQAILMKPIAKAGEPGDLGRIRQVARDMFNSAAERMLSTKMLRQVADEVDPYPELREEKGIDAVVEKLRRNIRIETNHRTGAINIYSSHSGGGRAAEMAADIANALTKGFVHAQREAINDTHTKLKVFLDSEKSRLRKDLEAAEERLEKFRTKHRGALPEDIATNLDRLGDLRQRIVDYRQNQDSAQHNLNQLDRELGRLQTEMALITDSGVDLSATLQRGEERLRELGLQLEDLLHVHSEDSREVKRQRNLIRAVTEANEQLSKAMPTGTKDVAKERKKFYGIMIEQYRKDRDQIQVRIKGHDKAIALTETQIEVTSARIVKAPTLESRLQSLQRTQEDANARWDDVCGRHASALRKKKLEDYDSTAPISLEQRAFVPARPASPDRLLTSFVGLILGLGIGVGLAIAHSKLDVSYQRADQLRSLLPGAVLVTIPDVSPAGPGRIGRVTVSVLMGLVLTSVFALTVTVLGIQLEWWGQPELIQPLLNLR